MNIIVTGGSGFIGSHFIREHLKRFPNDKVLNIDSLSYAGDLFNNKDYIDNENYFFFHSDINKMNWENRILIITNKERNHFLLKEVDIIFHFASFTHVDKSIKNTWPFIENDIDTTVHLLEFCKDELLKYNHLVKFFQISTDEVYGEALHKDGSIEEDPLMPKSPYAASKTGAERLAYSYNKTFNIPVLITRCGNNYGSNQYPEKLIPLFIKNMLQGKACPIYGDGENKRDWINVEDHVDAIIFLMQLQEWNGDVYNISGNCEKSVNEIFRELKKYFEEGIMISVEDRKGHVLRHAVDCSKLRMLGWNPKINFEEGIQKTVQWYKNNPNFLGGK